MSIDTDLIAASVGVLRDAYPRQEFPVASVRLYARQLRDLDPQALAEAVQRLIRRSEWLPSIAEIRREVATAALDAPSEYAAWSIVQLCAQQGGTIADVSTTEPVRAMLRAAVLSVGGLSGVRMSTQPGRTRDTFLAAYRALVESQVRQIAEGVVRQAAVMHLSRPAPQRELVAHETHTWAHMTPVQRAMFERLAGKPFEDTTPELRADAIRILGSNDGGDLLHVEAQRVLDAATREDRERVID